MHNWLLVGLGTAIAIVAIAILAGYVYETTNANRLVKTLVIPVVGLDPGGVYLGSLSKLPPPVVRYFSYALTDGQPLIKTATLRQSGTLRTSPTTDTWSSFTAHQVIVPPAIGFVWNAKVTMPFATHVRVLDSYINGVGLGRVSLLSALPIASNVGKPELNSGALLRYLAEAVWYPTALLPQSGIRWSPIDDGSALATLTNAGTTVSLTFRFNDAGEVASIYSPGRFATLNGAYELLPWEGHFDDYQTQDGMRIPRYGEVGWYLEETLQLVWKGNLVELQYQAGQ